jgi:hypothetical protein
LTTTPDTYPLKSSVTIIEPRWETIIGSESDGRIDTVDSTSEAGNVPVVGVNNDQTKLDAEGSQVEIIHVEIAQRPASGKNLLS